ncbi:MAG: hypothetical protein P1P76_08550 [Anaerolineales bacterium]|nr:hypothetical protein [Anaerolineales bacterium]
MTSSGKLRVLLTSFFALGLGFWWLYSQVLNPLPIHVGADPQMPYMMSSLSPFKGEPYTFIDHPGTPVEMAGTVILAGTYPFIQDSQTSFISAQIGDPSLFLLLTRTFILTLSLVTLGLLARHVVHVEHWTDELAAVSVPVLFFAIYPAAFDAVVTWSHNSFNYPLGALLGLGVILLFRDRAGGTRRQRALLGLLLGVFVAVQVYYVTWLFGALVAAGVYALLEQRNWRRSIVSGLQLGLAALSGFVLSTLPIASSYGEFVRWILAVSTHQGRHGSGPPGFISLETAADNFGSLVNQAPLIFAATVFTFILLGLAARGGAASWRLKPGLWACAAGFSAQLLIMLALIIKHPDILYLQAVAVDLLLLAGVVIALMRFKDPERQKLLRLGTFGLSLAICAIYGLGLTRALLLHRAVGKHVSAAEEAIAQYIQSYERSGETDGEPVIKLWVYGMPSDCNARWYGNRYAHYSFSKEIGSICPHDLNYDMWEGLVTLPDGSRVGLEDAEWDVLIANEAALLDFPQLERAGTLIYSEASLGTFGRIVYILNL